MAVVGNDIEEAAEWIKKGIPIAIPTETVYGLAANALRPEAVSKIFEIKNRPFFDPLIVHLHHANQLEKLVSSAKKEHFLLIEQFCPGPLTILFPKKDIIPAIVTSGLPDVAIRFPAHAMAIELLKLVDLPLAAPSANPFTYISPTQANHVAKQLGDKIPYILDGGACEIGIESSIVSILNDRQIILHRKGGISKEELEKQNWEVLEANSPEKKLPGSHLQHYSPRKKIIVGDLNALYLEYKLQHKIVSIAFEKNDKLNFVPDFYLSQKGDLNQAASRLFDILHQCDASDADLIIAEKVPQTSLGVAINDRLQRAEQKA